MLTFIELGAKDSGFKPHGSFLGFSSTILKIQCSKSIPHCIAALVASSKSEIRRGHQKGACLSLVLDTAIVTPKSKIETEDKLLE